MIFFVLQLHLNAVPENYLREDLRVDGARHLIFSTDRQLQVLSQAKTWYVDGTFKVLRPQDPFIQLYSVHAFLRNENDETKQVPLIFVFMSRRRKRDYKKVFKSIKSLISPSIPQSVVLDFERAAWAALKRVLPDVKISGCAFHWTQSLWRKLQNLGLSTNYREDEGTRKFVRKLMALPLLPENHIQETFQILQQKASAPIEPLMNYINATWIAGYWNPSDWSVYGKGIRTNNDCEGWHRRLNFRSSGPPPFYSLIDLLHKEANRLPIQIRLVSEKRLKKRQNKQYLSVQRKIFDLWCKYEEQTISTSRLLKDLSGVYIPSGL